MYIKGSKRKLQAKKTKRLIYETASRLFSEKNYNDVTIEEIAAAAGVSVGAFYHYFKNKQEIFAIFYMTLDEEYQEYYESMKEKPSFDKVKTLDRLEPFLLHTVDLIAKQGVDFLRVIYPYMLQDRDFGDSMIAPDRNFFRIIGEMIEEGKASGEIKAEIPTSQIISDITIICRGCEIDWCINHGSTTIKNHSASLIKNYLLGISSHTTE